MCIKCAGILCLVIALWSIRWTFSIGVQADVASRLIGIGIGTPTSVLAWMLIFPSSARTLRIISRTFFGVAAAVVGVSLLALLLLQSGGASGLPFGVGLIAAVSFSMFGLLAWFASKVADHKPQQVH